MANLIFVEGDADIRFLEDYLSYLGISERVKIQKTGGWTSIGNDSNKNEINQNTFAGGSNYIIFDANGDPIKRRQEILELVENKVSSENIFLLPDDNSQGDLEVLLEKLILPQHSPILACFEQYQNCLTGANAGYKVPVRKTKIYAYVDTLLPKNSDEKADEVKRTYLNGLWDLEAAAIHRLRDFLQKI